MKARALKSLILSAGLASLGISAFPAGINVDRLELITHGAIGDDGLFGVSSRLYFDLSFEGGDKFAGLLRMNFLSSSVESDLSDAGLTLDPDETDLPTIINWYNAKFASALSPRFQTAAVTARRIFGLPMEATYFVGYLDAFGSGDDFVRLFGAAPFGTALRGPMVYPNGVGGDKNRYYEGLDAVYGTGLRLGFLGKRDAFYIYGYQDSDLGAGHWTASLRELHYSGPLRVEVYAGASYEPESVFGVYKAGLLFDFAPGKVGEFFTQVGLMRWAFGEPLTIDDFFFLFEPRVNFYPGSLAITVFYHPTWYRQKATTEKGALDLNLNLKFGDVSKSGTQGGVSGLLSFRPLDTVPLTVDVAPYYAAITSGVEWSFKLDLRLFPIPGNWLAMFRPFIGVTTSF